MTAVDVAALPPLAVRVLTHHAGPCADDAALARAARHAHDELVRVLVR